MRWNSVRRGSIQQPIKPMSVTPSSPLFESTGESREKKDLVYVDSDGVQRANKPVGEALVERRKEGVHLGKVGAWDAE
jgi:hypothetical protein